MLFQFFAPAFLPLVVQQVPHTKTTSIHVQHSSVVAPLLLKEKDEREHDDFASISNLAPLLDLTAHSINLTASHKGKHNYFHQDLWYDLAPAIFTRLCKFLI
jgi:ABC-type Zn2+ transport system substrate-binding protein/surface adhesin